MKILITGASGFVGRHLTAALSRQRHEVLRLTHGPLDPADPRLFAWDINAGTMDERALEGVDAVIHLAGESIAGGRWTESQKQRIRDSRVLGTRLLLQKIGARDAKPKAFLAASAIGFYGDRGNEELDEASGPASAGQSSGAAFLAEVVKDWEAETSRAAELGMRLVQMRFGVVLGTDGGALGKMLLPFRLGLGGKQGSGAQLMSWITVQDLVRAILFLLEKPDCSGVYNLTAPNPATNAQFTQSLGRALSRPTFMAMPAFAARLVFGEMADGLLLAGQKVAPARLKAAGFQWESPFVGEGLNKLLNA